MNNNAKKNLRNILNSFSFVLWLVESTAAVGFALYFMRFISVFSFVITAIVIWYFYPFRKRKGYPGA